MVIGRASQHGSNQGQVTVDDHISNNQAEQGSGNEEGAERYGRLATGSPTQDQGHIHFQINQEALDSGKATLAKSYKTILRYAMHRADVSDQDVYVTPADDALVKNANWSQLLT